MGQKQWAPGLFWPSLPFHRPPTLPPMPFHYTTSRPIGLATENEEKRREGFRAFLSPLFLLNFSANISAVQHIQSPKWKRMSEAAGAPLLFVRLPLLFTLDLRRGLCRLWDHMLLMHTHKRTHTHAHTHSRPPSLTYRHTRMYWFCSHEWNCQHTLCNDRELWLNSMQAICFMHILLNTDNG